MARRMRGFELFRRCSAYGKFERGRSDPQAQLRRMMAQMIVDEGRNEIIAVIVTRMPTQAQRLTGDTAGVLEHVGKELLGEKFVGQTLVDQNFPRERITADDLAGVVVPPSCAVSAEVAREGLLSPRAAAGRGNGREGGKRTETSRITQAQHQGAVAAHGMAEQAAAIDIGGKLRGAGLPDEDQAWDFG